MSYSGLVFLLICREGGHMWSEKTRFPPSERPQGSAAEDTLTESRGRISPRWKCVCVCVCVGVCVCVCTCVAMVVAGVGVQGKLLPTPQHPQSCISSTSAVAELYWERRNTRLLTAASE